MPVLTKAEKEKKRVALAMAFRRAVLNQRDREEKAAAERERKAQASHEKRMARRDGTNKLAAERIEDCKRYPSPHAVRQLGGIAARADLGATVRVEAAATLLDMGHMDPMALAEKLAAEQAAKRRPRKPRLEGTVAERLSARGN